MQSEFVEGVHYYWEDGLMVLTSHFLDQRGYCCKSGCRHCPYGYTRHKDRVLTEESKEVKPEEE